MQCGLCGNSASGGRCNNRNCFNVGGSSNMVSSYGGSSSYGSSSSYGQMPSYPVRVAPIVQARVVYPQAVVMGPSGWGGAIIGGPYIGNGFIYQPY
jgi:hypothetical protein